VKSLNLGSTHQQQQHQQYGFFKSTCDNQIAVTIVGTFSIIITLNVNDIKNVEFRTQNTD
jgi:hypothetical protein